jgi:PAS domain S-box-containing protein
MQNAHPKTALQTTMDKARIRFPILAPLFVSILVLLATFTIAVYHLQEKNINDNLRKQIENTNEFFKDELAKDAKTLGAAIHLLKHDPKLQELWLAEDRDALLNYTAPIFEELRNEYQITHFYFIDVNNTCFLRVHNPDRFGDHIDRFSLNSAASTGKPTWGIELGPYGNFTLREVHPWFVNNTLIGFIELGEEIEHITPQLKEVLDVDLVFLINKSLLTRDGWEEGLKVMGRSGNWDLMPDRVIIDSTTSDIPPEFIKFAGLPHSQHEDRFVSATLNGSTYLAGCVQLIDAAGRGVGDILVIRNTSKEQASLRALLAVIAVLCFFIGALLGSFFYAHITRIEKRLIDAHTSLETEIEKRKEAESELRRHQDNLEETIRSRTAELEETNKHLQEEITEHKKAKDALQNSEERFRQVAESAGDWIWEVNAEGLYTYSSPVSEKLLGYKPEEIVGKKCFYDFFAPEIKEEFKKDALAVFNKKESFAGFINPLKHKNGSTVVLETTGTPILDDKGNLCGYRGADRDITERNRAQHRQAQLLEQLGKINRSLQEENIQRTKAEKQLEKLNADLESTVTQLSQSNGQLRDFVHLATHDLRTPLRGIGILAQWLLQDYHDKFDDQGRQQVDLLVRRVERMDKLMDAILQYSTIARNKRDEHRVDLNLLFNIVLAEIKPPPNIKITTNKDLPIVTCEEGHIQQVFYNLIDNAVKFMDKPEGHITINYTEEERFWKFAISDNGPGIAPQHFERIFRLFQTLNDRDQLENTGVGLPLVKKIVELYGGRIWLTSKLGEGATFFFTLPMEPAAVAQQTLQSVAT